MQHSTLSSDFNFSPLPVDTDKEWGMQVAKAIII
jgi:hypothetical protein